MSIFSLIYVHIFRFLGHILWPYFGNLCPYFFRPYLLFYILISLFIAETWMTTAFSFSLCIQFHKTHGVRSSLDLYRSLLELWAVLMHRRDRPIEWNFCPSFYLCASSNTKLRQTSVEFLLARNLDGNCTGTWIRSSGQASFDLEAKLGRNLNTTCKRVKTC